MLTCQYYTPHCWYSLCFISAKYESRSCRHSTSLAGVCSAHYETQTIWQTGVQYWEHPINILEKELLSPCEVNGSGFTFHHHLLPCHVLFFCITFCSVFCLFIHLIDTRRCKLMFSHLPPLISLSAVTCLSLSSSPSVAGVLYNPTDPQRPREKKADGQKTEKHQGRAVYLSTFLGLWPEFLSTLSPESG